MKSKDSGLKWIPLWVDKWLFGSTRIELKPDERSVWVDLMALAAKDNGYIRANPVTPYPIRQLAGLLNISEELLLRALKRFLETEKLLENEIPGIYYLLKWDEFALSDDYKKRINRLGRDYFKKGNLGHRKEIDHSQKMGIDSQITGAIEEYSIEENRIKNKNADSNSVFFECEFFKITNPHRDELLNEFPLIDFADLLKRLRNDCIDNPLRYKRNVHGHIKNLRNVLRNWCLREKPLAITPPEMPKVKSEPVKTKCSWCNEVYFIKDGHQCRVGQTT